MSIKMLKVIIPIWWNFGISFYNTNVIFFKKNINITFLIPRNSSHVLLSKALIYDGIS